MKGEIREKKYLHLYVMLVYAYTIYQETKNERGKKKNTYIYMIYMSYIYKIFTETPRQTQPIYYNEKI